MLRTIGSRSRERSDPALLLLLTFWLQAGHRGTQDLNLHLIGDAQLHGIALQAHNRAEQSRRW